MVMLAPVPIVPLIGSSWNWPDPLCDKVTCWLSNALFEPGFVTATPVIEPTKFPRIPSAESLMLVTVNMAPPWYPLDPVVSAF